MDYIENPVMRENAKHGYGINKSLLYVARPNTGHQFQAMHGRVAHQNAENEALGTEDSMYRQVELGRRAMDAMSIGAQAIFTSQRLTLGTGRLSDSEAQIAHAHNKWMVERFCVTDPRRRFLPCLLLQGLDMCLRIVREFAGKPNVVGFLVTNICNTAVHANRYMRPYVEIEDIGLPLAFHARPTWEDDWMQTMNRFLSVHAISFMHCNVVHLTNWVINGQPERFPKLKVMWVESGLGWVPFLMQRLDREYLKRISETPHPKKLPSGYMTEMYYSSQPLKVDHPRLLQSTMKAMKAEAQLVCFSDWSRWDFDLPGSIAPRPWLTEGTKRNILGLNTATVFNLEGRGKFRPTGMGPGQHVPSEAGGTGPH